MEKETYIKEHLKICKAKKRKPRCAKKKWECFEITGDKRYLEPQGTYEIKNPR